MLNFKLKTNAINPFSTTPLEDYLRTLGITEVNEFMSFPNPSSEISGKNLNNAEKMVFLLQELFEQKKKFFLVVDCDTDGFTSSAIFYNYFKHLYPEADIEWALHEEKQHGIELDKIPEDREVIIVPDAGSNQLKEMDILNNAGKIVIIMDHHQVENKIPDLNNVLVVNNQISEKFENKALSGAGVVFKIIQLFDEIILGKSEYSNELYDLAALGIIADCMDSKTLDNNYIIYKGLKNIKNPMFKALIDKQSYSIGKEKPNKIDVAYYIAPLINGTIRMGTMEEKSLLFRGFIELNHTEYYEHVWRGSKNLEDFYHRSARIAFNVKNEQNRLKLKCLEYLKNKIEQNNLNENKIIAVITNDDDEVPVPKTITGLVAMELLKTYGKPSLVLRPVTSEDGAITYAGSGRSNSFEELPSFLDFVRDQEESVYAQGHACAFGTSIKAEEFDHFIQTCNEKMAHIDFADDTIYVDAYFKNKVNKQLILEFAKGANIYGNQIPEPTIALEAIISRGDISFMGNAGNSIKININDVPCIKFKDNDLVEKLKNISKAKVVLIGKTNLNSYNGYQSGQIMIQNIEVTPVFSGGLF